MIAKYYRAFRAAFPLISAARALYVARNAKPAAERVRFDFPDATESERGALFRNTRPACVYWRPTEYSPRGHGLPEQCGAYNPRSETLERGSSRHVRWIDGTKRAGLRLVGFADEIARAAHSRSIEHTGWFADTDGGAFQTFRGIVYRLPARGGRSVFVYGYADPNNADCALLCFDNDADTELEAARFADSFAEHMAESEREYQARESATMRREELAELIKSAQSEAREIRAELKAARARCKRWPNAQRPAALCRAIKAQLEAIRETVTRYREERDALADDYWLAVPECFRG